MEVKNFLGPWFLKMIDTERLMDEVVPLANGERADLSFTTERREEKEKRGLRISGRQCSRRTQKPATGRLYTQLFPEAQAKAHSWRDRGLVRAYGRTILEIRRVPRPCQDDWLRLLTSPLQSKSHI